MLSRNAQVLKFFLQQSPAGLGVTKLLKLAYLADVESRKYLGRPLTAFRYYWHNYGPFDRQFYTAIEELENAGYVYREKVPLYSYNGGASNRRRPCRGAELRRRGI